MRSAMIKLTNDNKALGVEVTIGVIVYFAGHGSQDGYNYILLN